MVRKVMISSTVRDLPRHREQVMHACLSTREPFLPKMMEHLPASAADAQAVSTALVDSCDIYLGVFGHRYGYVPSGSTLSVTEMEYRRALEREMPRLVFMMAEDHPVVASDVETGEGAERLRALRESLQTRQVVKFFSSPADLRAHALQSLGELGHAAAAAAPADADLTISSLLGGWRLRPLDGHPVLAVAGFESSVYTGGVRLSFTLAHNGQGGRPIHLHAIVPEVLEHLPGEQPGLDYRVQGDALFGAGVRQPRVFSLTLESGRVKHARWMLDAGAGVAAARSENLLDTDPPRVLHFTDARDDIEELQGTITLRSAGLVRLRFAFHYSVAGQDRTKYSDPVLLYARA
jgi:Domain of unknown function (DUF4062)